MSYPKKAITLAMTGASGALYGLRLLEILVQTGQTVYLLLSPPAHIVLKMEINLSLPRRANDIARVLSERYHAQAGQIQVFGEQQWTAPVASGSALARAMVICPCTNGTLAGIASGLSRNLIERAADVMLKEQRKLILVHRETPLSIIQLENMLRLARAGALILPANPGFYHSPTQINELVDFIVARILDHLDIEHQLSARWGETTYFDE
ncbi:UbiX family flavin prenyltransferase [Beggiatoa leptomitoformis]|uniref:Flavin prenyltransferase UbiX n=1 Tax=Beggiatoa leptomitoformis TaxID=288004 RepID=A0A2N9YEB5_9GAMM|nr:flavin prenyltransferase UbiX [Beggiatoa leptomitoformis]ALG68892.1 UbiX family flavin prenyltransferase [Beggiatoa leptomitoformis]AUI68735.1 UbiX family flavin prenyltransferase [Beggiatoa leptomitoformis]